MRNVIIFDLDETVINSSHRTPNNPDGSLNLGQYLKMQTPENIAKDMLLPIARIMRQRFIAGDFIVIITARRMSLADYDFLEKRGLPYHLILSRNDISLEHYKLNDGKYKLRHILPFLDLAQYDNIVMFDDAKLVKSELRNYFPVLCAHKINRKLRK